MALPTLIALNHCVNVMAHVLAFLAGQAAPHLDAHVLRLQDAHDPWQRRANGVRAVAGFAQGGADEGFNVHRAPVDFYLPALILDEKGTEGITTP